MRIAAPTLLLLSLLAAAPALAQGEDGEAVVDTTIVTDEGVILRYKGAMPTVDRPGGVERVEEMTQDDRVPLGYGFRTLRLWKQGDPRPAPVVGETRVSSEFIDLDYDGPYVKVPAALSFAEHADYAYFGIKERLGWDLPGGEKMPVAVPLDLERYGERYGLPWWVPGDVQGGTMIFEPISVITSRGFALEAFTHYYVEWQLRRRTGDRLPYWFMYGLGAYFGAEGWVLKGQAEILRGTHDIEIDQATMLADIEIFRDAELMRKEIETPGILEEERNRSRLAYWRAFRLVENLMTKEGLRPFKALVAALEADPALSFDDAVQAAYGRDSATLFAEHSPW